MILTFGVEPLTIPEGWKVVEDRMMRAFEFKDFTEAKAFIDAVSSICDAHNHHADLHFGWGYAVVETWTHDSNSITQQDIELAHAINAMEGV